MGHAAQHAASKRVGDLRFEERDALGAGGGGRVVRGVDRHLERDVALKIVGPEDPQALARLRREAAILVALEHPGIVPLYDLIERNDGGLQLALRIVRGRSLERVLADDRREAAGSRRTPERVRNLARAAEAVAWAHHEGFVHRDLKPANVMVGDFGEIQVIDWGLAVRRGEGDLPPNVAGAGRPAITAESFEPDLTRAGAVLGTPRYMSPEQARGERVDQRADVWSLGAILFELVAGRAAFAEGDVEQVLSAVREARPPDLKALAPRAPAELVAIVARAMAPDPEDRYPDARGFADDLNAYLDGRPVAAHRYALTQRVMRFVRRRRMPLAVAGGLVATAVAFALAPRGPVEVIEDSARAEALADDLARERRGLASVLAREAEDLLLKRRLPEAAATAARALDLAPTPVARGVIALAAGANAVRLLEETPLPVGACLSRALHPDGERWLCRRGDEVVLYQRARELWRHAARVDGAVFTAGGARVALFDLTRSVVYLDTASGAERWRSPLQDCGMTLHQGAGAELAYLFGRRCLALLDGETTAWAIFGPWMQAAALTRDRRWAVLANDDTLIHGAYDASAPPMHANAPIAHGVASRTATALGAEVMDVMSMALVRDEVVVGTLRGALVRVGLDGRTRVRTILREEVPVTAIEPSPSGAILIVGFDRGGPALVERESLQLRAVLPEADRGATASSGDTSLVTVAGRRATWEIASRIGALAGLNGLAALAVDERRLAVVHERAVDLFDRPAGVALARIDNPTLLKSIALHPRRAELVWSGIDASAIERWDEHAGRLAGPPATIVRRLAYTASGTLLALPYMPELWVVAPSAPELIERRAGDGFVDVAIHGERAALLTRKSELVLLELAAGPVELARCAWPGTHALSLSADGAIFVAALEDEVALIDVGSCAVVGWLDARVDQIPMRLTDVQVSADGRWIAAGARSGRVLVWRDRELLAAVHTHDHRVAQLAFTPDSRQLYSGGWDGAVQVFDLAVLGQAEAAQGTWARAAWGL